MVQVLAKSDKEDPVPSLRNSVVFTPIKLGMDSVASLFQISQDGNVGPPPVGIHQPTDILGDEDEWLVAFEDSHSSLIERPEGAIESLLLSHSAEVVAGEAKGQSVYRRESREVHLGDIAAVDCLAACPGNAAAVGLAGERVEVHGPGVSKSCLMGAIPQPPWS